MKFSLQHARNNDGAVLVEMAVSAIVFLTVLLGSFEAFMAIYSFHYVSYAANDAARYALVRGSNCSTISSAMTNCNVTQAELQTYVDDLNFPGINASNLTVTLNCYVSNNTTPNTWSSTAQTCSSGYNQPGNLLKVKVTYTNPLNIPFIPSLPLNFSSTASMVISN